MQFFELIFAIPIIAIVMGVGSEIIKTVLRSKERQLEIKANISGTKDADLIRQIQELRAALEKQGLELEQLRDTATSYDLTIDSQLQRLERRLEFMEGKHQKPAAPAVEKQVQRLGR